MLRHMISNSDDLIESCDVIKRISDLEGKLEDTYNADRLPRPDCNGTGDVDGGEDSASVSYAKCDECNGSGEVERVDEDFEEWLKAQAENHDNEEAQELIALRALAEEAEGYAPDWRHGEALIRDSYFEDYARDLAEDIGAINRDTSWPHTCIDWEKAASDLQHDYTSVDFDGVTYWIRSWIRS